MSVTATDLVGLVCCSVSDSLPRWDKNEREQIISSSLVQPIA